MALLLTFTYSEALRECLRIPARPLVGLAPREFLLKNSPDEFPSSNGFEDRG